MEFGRNETPLKPKQFALTHPYCERASFDCLDFGWNRSPDFRDHFVKILSKLPSLHSNG